MPCSIKKQGPIYKLASVDLCDLNKCLSSSALLFCSFIRTMRGPKETINSSSSAGYNFVTLNEFQPLYIKAHTRRDLPGAPVVKTPHSHCRGQGFNPWSGN